MRNDSSHFVYFGPAPVAVAGKAPMCIGAGATDRYAVIISGGSSGIGRVAALGLPDYCLQLEKRDLTRSIATQSYFSPFELTVVCLLSQSCIAWISDC
jgi:hypothetical protein